MGKNKLKIVGEAHKGGGEGDTTAPGLISRKLYLNQFKANRGKLQRNLAPHDGRTWQRAESRVCGVHETRACRRKKQLVSAGKTGEIRCQHYS